MENIKVRERGFLKHLILESLKLFISYTLTSLAILLGVILLLHYFYQKPLDWKYLNIAQYFSIGLGIFGGYMTKFIPQDIKTGINRHSLQKVFLINALIIVLIITICTILFYSFIPSAPSFVNEGYPTLKILPSNLGYWFVITFLIFMIIYFGGNLIGLLVQKYALLNHIYVLLIILLIGVPLVSFAAWIFYLPFLSKASAIGNMIFYLLIDMILWGINGRIIVKSDF
ncbi:MAG: hypothetical protein Q4Q07_00680 [Tissierellia bacterium]|nr:hypothetical protein [Tissierellia bacterium]